MNMKRNLTISTLRRSVLLTALLVALPMVVNAQIAAASSSSAASMAMGSMAGMSMPASSTSTAKPASAKAKKRPLVKKSALPVKAMKGMPGMNHDAMPGMTPSSPSAVPPAPSGDMQGMHHDSMPGMDHAAMSDMAPQAKPTTSTDRRGMDNSTMPSTSPEAMKDMDHGTMSGMHTTTPQSAGAMGGLSMGSMQGGSAPPGARSPDYSDGVGYGSMKPHLAGSGAVGKLLIDQLEAFDGRDGNGQSWELGGWYGTDENKLWIRSEGERSAGKVQDGDAEVLWNHAIATYWGSQLGVRHDFGVGPERTWAAFGVEGLAPYWFELEATGYVGSSGRTAARLRVNYDVLFTQRLILTPELEANLYGKNDPARRIGSGLSDVQFGLRLRYEVRRQFAPYIGVVWTRRFGSTADFARADRQAIFDRQWVAGLRIWF
jgi:copper resistance protein B